MHYMYILKNNSSNPLFYIGATSDLRKRIALHNAGKVPSTRGRTWQVVYYEAFQSRAAAFAREQRLKRHAKGWLELKQRIGV